MCFFLLIVRCCDLFYVVLLCSILLCLALLCFALRCVALSCLALKRCCYRNTEVAAAGFTPTSQTQMHTHRCQDLVYPSIPDTNAYTSLLGLAPATVNTNMHVKIKPTRTHSNMLLVLILRCCTLLCVALLCSALLCCALLCFA